MTLQYSVTVFSRILTDQLVFVLWRKDDEAFYKEKYGEEVFHDSNSDFDIEEEESWDELDTDFDEDEVSRRMGERERESVCVCVCVCAVCRVHEMCFCFSHVTQSHCGIGVCRVLKRRKRGVPWIPSSTTNSSGRRACTPTHSSPPRSGGQATVRPEGARARHRRPVPSERGGCGQQRSQWL